MVSDRGQAPPADVLRCSDIRKTYRDGALTTTALDGVDLTVEPGEFLALAGPSGSGKTTLLNILGGLDDPDSGEVWLGNRRLTSLTRSERADLRLHAIGFVFQAYNLIPVLSAEENVEFVMHLQGIPAAERRRRAREILDRVGLSGLYRRRPAEMSGGQQQRVAVARALVTRPAVVLADEPTANLDSQTGRALLETMQQMCVSLGVTFVFSTHDAMVMAMASRLVRIHDGRIESARPVAEVQP